jgi:hypothetical protein
VWLNTLGPERAIVIGSNELMLQQGEHHRRALQPLKLALATTVLYGTSIVLNAKD